MLKYHIILCPLPLFQNLDFQDKQVRINNKNDRLEVKDVAKCGSEMDALLETEAAMPSVKSRRVGDFTIADQSGVPEPIEALQFSQKELFLSK